MNTISAAEPDWSREEPRAFWDTGRKLLKALRAYQRLKAAPGPVAAIRRKLAVLRHAFWSFACQCEIPLNCEIGGGLLLPHPNGIVIHPLARLGPNCLLMHQTTLGVTAGKGAPTLGGHVDVGAGAKIIGPVTVGDHAVIGANAVVVADVAAGDVVGGIPARSLRAAAATGTTAAE